MEDPLAGIPPELCVQCKASRGLCGIDPCPLLARVREVLPKSKPVKTHFTGASPPNLFVGRYGYPKVEVGPMLTPDVTGDSRLFDAPSDWFRTSTIPEVIGLRSSLVRTRHAVRIEDARNPDRITALTQELAMSATSVDTEVRVTRVPTFTALHVGQFEAPHGPSVELKRAELTQNPRVENPVERIVSDTDVKATTAIEELWRAGQDTYQMEKLLTAGLLGQADRRRFVPTRWGITATDDSLGKILIDRLQDYPSVDHPILFTGGGYGNHFTTLILPGPWGFDYVEAWMKGAFWAREAVYANDWEGPQGRKDYASNTVGGYYAARLGVLEWLDQHQRTGTVVCLREITDEYTTPLGVWVVREASRSAMANPPQSLETTTQALATFWDRCKGPRAKHAFQYLPAFLAQRRLSDFP